MSAGLSSREAKDRLNRIGPNETPATNGRSFLASAWEIISEPMLVLLIVAALAYLVIGDLAEGLLLVGFAVLSLFLVFYQQRRSDKALQSLRALGAPNARVIRDGIELTIPAREIVPGDNVVIEEGDRIAADGVLLAGQDLIVDESVLTGESVPVRKIVAEGGAEAYAEARPGGDDLPFLFSGTLVVRGHGVIEVVETGARTRVGNIGTSLASIAQEQTRLQQSTAKIVRLFGALSLIVSASIFVFYALIWNDWLQGILSGIAVAMAMLPEEIPVALMVFFAIGAWRLAQIKVLARQPAVVEMLGATTVLCVDKTGTLTENRMRISMLDVDGETFVLESENAELPKAFFDLVEAAHLATARSTLDPMDMAVSQLAQSSFNSSERLHAEWPLAREYGITPELLAMSRAWQDDGGNYVVATKGAPEAIADLCHLDAPTKERQIERARAMARNGLRVLGVASGKRVGGDLPDKQHDFDFTFLGLIGFQDPVRATAPAAVEEAQRAGISVKMITGDFSETAMAIADSAHIDHAKGVMTGEEIARMSDENLSAASADINVYARMMPEQKLRLVNALKTKDAVVAMTGDGVNDAPALKTAHIGIAMGARGTDVAREASDIVLLDEDFGRIISAVRMGRRIYDNLRKVMIYIASAHVPIAGLAIIPLLFGMPPLLFPAHVVLVEMIIDPMSSVSFETTPDEPDLMDRPPRPVSEPIAGVPQFAFGILLGCGLLAICLLTYWLSVGQGASTDQARALVFLSMTAGNLALVRVNDTRAIALSQIFAPGHRVFWLIAVAASAIVAACIFHPSLQRLFVFETPDPVHAGLAIAGTLVAAFALDLVKFLPVVQRIIGRSRTQPSSPKG